MWITKTAGDVNKVLTGWLMVTFCFCPGDLVTRSRLQNNYCVFKIKRYSKDSKRWGIQIANIMTEEFFRVYPPLVAFIELHFGDISTNIICWHI